jgi:hypothetical protein
MLSRLAPRIGLLDLLVPDAQELDAGDVPAQHQVELAQVDRVVVVDRRVARHHAQLRHGLRRRARVRHRAERQLLLAVGGRQDVLQAEGGAGGEVLDLALALLDVEGEVVADLHAVAHHAVRSHAHHQAAALVGLGLIAKSPGFTLNQSGE